MDYWCIRWCTQHVNFAFCLPAVIKSILRLNGILSPFIFIQLGTSLTAPTFSRLLLDQIFSKSLRQQCIQETYQSWQIGVRHYNLYCDIIVITAYLHIRHNKIYVSWQHGNYSLSPFLSQCQQNKTESSKYQTTKDQHLNPTQNGQTPTLLTVLQCVQYELILFKTKKFKIVFWMTPLHFFYVPRVISWDKQSLYEGNNHGYV